MTAVPRGFHRTNVMGVPQKMDREELAVVTYSVDSLACPRLQIHAEAPYAMRETVITCARVLRKAEEPLECGHRL